MTVVCELYKYAPGYVCGFLGIPCACTTHIFCVDGQIFLAELYFTTPKLLFSLFTYTMRRSISRSGRSSINPKRNETLFLSHSLSGVFLSFYS